MTRSVAVDLAAGRVVDRSRAPGWAAPLPDPPSEITNGIDLTTDLVGINGANLEIGDLDNETGNIRSNADGEIIEGVNIDTGRVTVRHDNVTVRNLRVDGGVGDYGIVVEAGVTGFRAEFVEVQRSISAGVYMIGAGECYRVRVENAVDSFKVGSNQILTECYASSHDTQGDPDAHLDVCQATGGSNVLIRRNYFRLNALAGGSPNGCIQWDANFSPLTNYTAEDNYFWGWPGANYPVRVTYKDSSGQSEPDNVTFTGNIWEDGAWTSAPVVVEQGSGWVWEDNETTTGTPVTI